MLNIHLDKNVALSAQIVSAYVSRNALAASELPSLLAITHASLLALGHDKPPQTSSEPQKPFVSIRKSVTDDHIVCLEDGRRFKSLKRHLRVRYDMTPEQYRQKWQLPPDYPMVAPGYTQRRSVMARSMGLGQPRGTRKPA